MAMSPIVQNKRDDILRMSEPLRHQYDTIPWRRIAGLRDVLIHDYMGVDLEAVWEITQRQLPELHRSIQLILKTS